MTGRKTTIRKPDDNPRHEELHVLRERIAAAMAYADDLGLLMTAVRLSEAIDALDKVADEGAADA